MSASTMPDWQPISTAPPDGSWVLVTGGYDGREFEDEDEDEDGDEDTSNRDPVAPVVVAFWNSHREGWTYAYWDDGWRSRYVAPTHWMPMMSLPQPTRGG